MLAILLSAFLVIAASLAIGRAAMLALGWRSPEWFGAAVGFAALVTIAPFAARLPGRGLTAAILLASLAVACVFFTRRNMSVRARTSAPRAPQAPRAFHRVALAVVVGVVAAACLPFAFNERTGVLGEGIYTNDHGAQLYWADWLADGFGPRPDAVGFGYPVGPQALAAAVSEGTATELDDAFNGIIIAIPALTALAALSALGGLGPVRRGVAAGLAGLPYLGASFLAQSGFKETAMGMFALALAVALHRYSAARDEPEPPPVRAAVGVIAILVVASVSTFSLPGIAWFAAALPAFLVLSALTGDLSVERMKDEARRHRGVLIGIGVVLAGIFAIALGSAAQFVDRIADVQQSRGRLDSPVFPGEALGIWPEGDFRLVRGEVPGSLLATAFAALCAGLASLALIRRREWGLLAVLGSGALVYAVSRPVAEIHVEAKALAVLAPVAMLVTMRWLFAPSVGGWGKARVATGVVFAALAAASTFLALRAAPVGFDDRGEDLHRLAERVEGERVLFLGVDRFGAYYLRGTLVQSPGGYVPPDVEARPEKVWQQGDPLDFDTLRPSKLDNYDYAVTTAAEYASTPPPSFREVAREGDWILWERVSETPPTEVLNEAGRPGRINECEEPPDGGEALVLDEPTVIDQSLWDPGFAFDAPGEASATAVVDPGSYDVSLQYHSQVPLTVRVDGEDVARMPATLEGLYATAPGRGAFWPAGEAELDGGPVRITVEADEPSSFQDLLGVERRVWVGDLALSPRTEPRTVPLAASCGEYVDHYERRG